MLGFQGRVALHDAFRPDVDYADGLLACDEGRIDAGVAHFEAAFAAEPDGVGYGRTSHSRTWTSGARGTPWT